MVQRPGNESEKLQTMEKDIENEIKYTNTEPENNIVTLKTRKKQNLN
jgi:hypothetical protein